MFGAGLNNRAVVLVFLFAALFVPGRYHLWSALRIGRQHPMVANQVVPGFWYQRDQFADEVDG
jgi:hypothetical protein